MKCHWLEASPHPTQFYPKGRECSLQAWKWGDKCRVFVGEGWESRVGFWWGGKSVKSIFWDTITLALKIRAMAFFKSHLDSIYISEQTAYCFHQGKISTHVYLMFPSKYLHFKAF